MASAVLLRFPYATRLILVGQFLWGATLFSRNHPLNFGGTGLTLTTVILALSGCAGSSDEERSVVNKEWVACIGPAVDRVDDGRTDPVSLAYGIQSICAAQSEKVTRTYYKSLLNEDTRAASERIQLKAITGLILQHRSNQRLQSNAERNAPQSDSVWQAAAQAEERKDYVTEIALLRPLAERGDATAEAVLAMNYVLGNGVSKDDVEAAVWSKKSAEQGDASGQYILGKLYERGAGVRQDPVQAYAWLSLSASQHEKHAVEDLPNLKLMMTADQVASAEQAVSQWHPQQARNCTADHSELTKLAQSKGYQYSSGCGERNAAQGKPSRS